MPLFVASFTHHARRLIVVGSVFFALCALLIAVPVAQGQQAEDIRVLDKVPFETIMSYEDVCDLENDPRDMNTFRVADTVLPKSQQTQITVNYGSGFTTEARQAFQRAVDVWKTHIQSSVEIRIQASFESLGQGTLAAAGPRFIYRVDRDNGDEVIMGDALVDALIGTDQSPGEPDIIVRVNSERTDWNFDEAPPASNEIDFTTVILHEIGHGLNFFNLTGVDNGEGFWGLGRGADRPEEDKVPGVLEELMIHEESSGTFNEFTDRSIYPNPSTELGDILTSNALFVTGENLDIAAENSTGPVPAQIYAPTSYQPGSSIAHFDEATYPAGDPNALMTPRIGFNEVARDPGPNFCGLLADMGWPLNQGCQEAIGAEVFAFGAAAFSQTGNVALSWSTGPAADDIDEYIIKKQRFDGSFEEIERLPASNFSGSEVVFSVEDLSMGRYRFELSWIVEGESTPSGGLITDSVEINVFDVEAIVEGEVDQQGRAPVRVSWQLPPDPSGFEFEVERAAGLGSEDPNFMIISDMMTTGVQATFPRQAAGNYQYRIRSTDQDGNVLLSEADDARIPFESPVVLTEAYPNPSDGAFRFDITAENTQAADVEVYNSIGQRVFRDRIGLQQQVPKEFEISEARNWSSGMYFVRIIGTDFSETRRVAIVR